MKRIKINAINLSGLCLLSACSVWEDDFDEPVVRAMPKTSIHKISTLIDQGVISEKEAEPLSNKILPAPQAPLQAPLFADGKVSRGFEDVRRVFLLPYEDADKTLRGSRHLYVVVRPASWTVDGGAK
jgi:hypothetical protein